MLPSGRLGGGDPSISQGLHSTGRGSLRRGSSRICKSNFPTSCKCQRREHSIYARRTGISRTARSAPKLETVSRPRRGLLYSDRSFKRLQPARRPGSTVHRQLHTRLQSSLQEEVLLPLGLDFLTFLAATVIVIPVFKSVKASPVLGFLFSGLVLGQLG